MTLWRNLSMNTDKLNELLNLYARDTENSELNWNLALEYHALGQTAAAITYYLRAAERTADKLLAYECLLKIAACFDSQKNRPSHVIGCYKHALCLLPERPEAYFLLSRFNERNRWYMEAYVAAEQGLNFAKTEYPKLRSNVEYPGRYGLLFEKAVSAWWWGDSALSRKLFRKLKNDHAQELDETHYRAVENNLSRLGAGPASYVFKRYDRSQYNLLRHKFNNAEVIENNHSQILQDMFVLTMLNGKKNGSYLEIGSGDAFWGNNTAILEKLFGWKGVGVELDGKLVEGYRNQRSNPVLQQNALEVDYDKVLSDIAQDNCVDYLQLDCEPPRITYEIMTKIPFDKYKFAVITFEHDHYVDMSNLYRAKSREFLSTRGYKLVINDVACDDECTQEDWWVHPDLVDSEIIEKMQHHGDSVVSISNFFFGIENQKEIKYEPSFSFKSKKRVWIVDDFYDNPEEVRKFALEQEYLEGGLGRGFIGRRTHQQFLFPGLKERFEEIIGTKIQRWEEHGMNGRFQISWAGEPLVYHCDSQRWGGMLYLTPEAPFESGTTLYAHKKTRVRDYHHPRWGEVFPTTEKTHLDKTPFEPVDVLGNVYNRLVIFDASCIHSASEYFGQNKIDGRLWQMFFFD